MHSWEASDGGKVQANHSRLFDEPAAEPVARTRPLQGTGTFCLAYKLPYFQELGCLSLFYRGGN